MLGIGMGEMVIIAGVALVVIGPDRFPEFAKIVLRTVRDLRGYVDEAKRDISKELKPVQKEIESLSRYNPEDYIDSLAGAVTGDEDAEKSDSQKAADSEALNTAAGTDPYSHTEDDLDGEYQPYDVAASDEPSAAEGPDQQKSEHGEVAADDTGAVEDGGPQDSSEDKKTSDTTEPQDEPAPDPYYDTGDSESHLRKGMESEEGADAPPSESDSPERLDG